MGGQHSTEAADAQPRSYDNDKYKPVKNGKKKRSSKSSTKHGEPTINNNYIPAKPPRVDPVYNITYSSDDTVTAHKEMTELRLENVNADYESGARAISPLRVDVMCETENRLHFKIYDPSHARFEVAAEGVEFSPHFKKAAHTAYDFEYREKPFGLSVTRKATGHVLFDSSYGKFHFDDERIHITTSLYSQYVYGLGEHQKSFLIDTTQAHNFVFWAKGGAAKEGDNLYGCHPFFMALEEDGNAYGVFLLNSCAMELRLTPGDPAVLSYTTNGGILDFYIITGPSPVEVIQQYQEIIGRPHLPPYWSLGFHLCRWGYNSAEELQKVVEANRKTGIPYESQWTDIDMMDQCQSWTHKDPQLQTIVQNLHINGQRYITIVDPGVSLTHKTQTAYTDGLQADIFIKNNTGARPLVGKVWPGETVFPDFSHPDIYDYWFRQAQSLYDDIPFDGLWLDMNEPESFIDGCVEDCNLTTTHHKDHPDFVPEGLAGGKLFHQTVCPSAQQYQGLHYQLHNMYGHMQMKVSNRVCEKLRGRRSLIISRSTFPGSGKYGGHWTGDNSSTFHDLRASISSMLDFNLFGIPLVGADIGGFQGSCSEELMIRWMQLGAFYPFMRNHNSCLENGADPQDPARYSEKAQSIMADIVCLRYSLLPYLYTLLYENHTKGVPVVRPLYMLFPKDKKTYALEDQFMWGSCLLFSPCVTQGQSKVQSYFPFDVWYNFYSGYRLPKVGTVLDLPAPLKYTNIHVRGGSIIVTQTPARNTSFSRNNPFGLLAALDSNHSAHGKLYWDDGDVLEPIETKRYNLIKFKAERNRLTTTVEQLGYTDCNMRLKLVQVFGLFVQPETVLVNGKSTVFSYTDTHRVLQLDKLDVSLIEPLVIEW